MPYSTLQQWLETEAISFSLTPSPEFDAAVDNIIARLPTEAVVLGLGEPTHLIEDFLVLRNRIFRRLVEAHGFCAIALESSFPRGPVTQAYIDGGSGTYDDIQETGFSHNFGHMAANRELVEWMRAYNADPDHGTKLSFYGFDSPTEMMTSDSPRPLLEFVLNYLESMEYDVGKRRDHLDFLLGEDAEWETPGAVFDAGKSIGSSERVAKLRVETEELLSTLQRGRPGLVKFSGERRYLEARQYGILAREMLTYHAETGRNYPDKVSNLLGLRDAMMAGLLAYIVERERGRGKVLAFGQNAHMMVGASKMRWGTGTVSWWPVGAHMNEILGAEYAAIGVGAGTIPSRGIGVPESDSLEGRLLRVPGPVRFVATHRGTGLPAEELAVIPTRTVPPTYIPFSAESTRDFDGVILLDEAG